MAPSLGCGPAAGRLATLFSLALLTAAAGGTAPAGVPAHEGVQLVPDDPEDQPLRGSDVRTSWNNGFNVACLPAGEAMTEGGKVKGCLADGFHAHKFLGIPFAKAPVGELRFRSPQRASPWSGVRHARTLYSCPQFGFDVTKKMTFTLGGEDCLYLNVYVPAGAKTGDKLPVMAWLFGGAFIMGSANEFGLYDGSKLAGEHGVVVVTINYRLAALGFWASDTLLTEGGATGNYAMQDQRAGLQWIQRNIAAFGGDPSRVTLFGESAGGFSTVYHLVSPRSAGLFSAAIIQSSNSDNPLAWQTYNDSTHFYRELASQLGCPKQDGPEQLACLRTLPFELLTETVNTWIDDIVKPTSGDAAFGSPLAPVLPFAVTVDGTDGGLPDVPVKMVESGRFNRVPVVIGSNKDGGSLFEPLKAIIMPGARTSSDENVRKVVEWFFRPADEYINGTSLTSGLLDAGEQSQNIGTDVDYTNLSLSFYQKEEFISSTVPNDALLSHYLRDVIFMCSNRRLARALAAQGVSTHLYVWDQDMGPIIRGSHLADFHASELPFVFGNWLELYKLLLVPNTKEMSKLLQCTWTRFALCHDPVTCPSGVDPNGCSSVRLPPWDTVPSNTSTSPTSFMMLDTNARTAQLRQDNKYPDDAFPSNEKCDFWQGHAQFFQMHLLKQNPYGDDAS